MIPANYTCTYTQLFSLLNSMLAPCAEPPLISSRLSKRAHADLPELLVPPLSVAIVTMTPGKVDVTAARKCLKTAVAACSAVTVIKSGAARDAVMQKVGLTSKHSRGKVSMYGMNKESVFLLCGPEVGVLVVIHKQCVGGLFEAKTPVSVTFELVTRTALCALALFAEVVNSSTVVPQVDLFAPGCNVDVCAKFAADITQEAAVEPRKRFLPSLKVDLYAALALMCDALRELQWTVKVVGQQAHVWARCLVKRTRFLDVPPAPFGTPSSDAALELALDNLCVVVMASNLSPADIRLQTVIWRETQIVL